MTATSGELEARGRRDAETRGVLLDVFERFFFVVIKLSFPRSPSPRVSISPRLRVALRSLIQRETALAIKIVKVLCLDEIKTGARDAIQQGHDLVVGK